MIRIFALLLLMGCSQLPRSESGKTEYQKGLETTILFERKNALNSALSQLLKSPPSSATYQNLSHVMQLLGQDPWAVYYTYQALKQNPRDREMETRLDALIQSANLPPRAQENPFGPLIRWHQILSKGEKFILFFFSVAALFALCSLKIWREGRMLLPLIGVMGLIAALLGGSLLYTHYFAPLEGVLIKPAALYRDASRSALLVKDVPLPAGLKLDVLEEKEEGQWLKVRTDQGEYGFVDYRAIRLLEP